jgi:transposase
VLPIPRNWWRCSTPSASPGPPVTDRLKQFRAVATRYDKLRDDYHATVTIASIMIWLRAKPTEHNHDPSDSL